MQSMMSSQDYKGIKPKAMNLRKDKRSPMASLKRREMNNEDRDKLL